MQRTTGSPASEAKSAEDGFRPCAAKTRVPRLTPHQQQLAADNYRLALWMANKAYWRHGRRFPLDDILGTAHTALVYAAARYDSTRGKNGPLPFGTFAGVVIRQQLEIFARRGNARKRRSLDFAPCISELHDSEETLEFPDQRTPPPEVQALIAEILRLLREMLPEKVWRLLERHFLEGESQSDIARSLGVSHQRVQQRMVKALAAARWYVDRNGDLPVQPPPEQRERKEQTEEGRQRVNPRWAAIAEGRQVNTRSLAEERIEVCRAKPA